MKWFRPILFAIAALALTAGAKKDPKVSVRFFEEANGQDTDTFASPVQFHYPERTGYIDKIPVVSERDVDAIFPFHAADGTMGCAFKLDNHGRMGLLTVSTERRGSSIMVFLNGRQVVDMIVDKPVMDGIITIPQGLTDQEIAALQKSFPTLGRGKNKKHEEPAPDPNKPTSKEPVP